MSLHFIIKRKGKKLKIFQKPSSVIDFHETARSFYQNRGLRLWVTWVIDRLARVSLTIIFFFRLFSRSWNTIFLIENSIVSPNVRKENAKRSEKRTPMSFRKTDFSNPLKTRCDNDNSPTILKNIRIKIYEPDLIPF